MCLLTLPGIVLGATGEPLPDPAGADQWEAKATERWQQGDVAGTREAHERAVALDPGNPVRAYRFGEWLCQEGAAATARGEVAGAAEAFAEAERQLTAAIRLAEPDPAQSELVGESYRMLGDIAGSVRRDRERAKRLHADAQRVAGPEPVVPTTGAPLFGPVGEAAQARRIERTVAEPANENLPPPVKAIDAANVIQMGGRRLRLASEGDREGVRVREYYPVGESAEEWGAIYAQRIHRQFLAPRDYANRLSDQAAGAGGRVISAVSGPEESASLAFVIHAPEMALSEVNVWRFVVRDGFLVSLQYAERVRGTDHVAQSEALARRKSAGWLRELSVRRPVGVGDAAARFAATAAEEP